MNINERRKYLHKMRSLYGRASRRQKSALLTEIEPVTGLHRNSLLRLLHGDLRRKPLRRQRGPIYTAVTRQVVRLCAEALDDPCAERLQPVLLPHGSRPDPHGHLHLTPEVEAQRAHISVSTARRMVGSVGQQPSRLAASPRTTRRRSAVARSAPVPWRPCEGAQPLKQSPGVAKKRVLTSRKMRKPPSGSRRRWTRRLRRLAMRTIGLCFGITPGSSGPATPRRLQMPCDKTARAPISATVARACSSPSAPQVAGRSSPSPTTGSLGTRRANIRAACPAPLARGGPVDGPGLPGLPNPVLSPRPPRLFSGVAGR